MATQLPNTTIISRGGNPYLPQDMMTIFWGKIRYITILEIVAIFAIPFLFTHWSLWWFLGSKRELLCPSFSRLAYKDDIT